MSNNDSAEQSPSLTMDECFLLLDEFSISAFNHHKTHNVETYDKTIDSLSKICAMLVNYYDKAPDHIIKHQEQALINNHKKDISTINEQIQVLFKKRQQAPPNSFYGEREIISLTEKINSLEERKKAPVNELIQKVIYDTFTLACDNFNAQLPLNFNINEYECHANGIEENKSTDVKKP